MKLTFTHRAFYGIQTNRDGALSGRALSQERMLNVEASTRLLAAMTGKDKK